MTMHSANVMVFQFGSPEKHHCPSCNNDRRPKPEGRPRFDKEKFEHEMQDYIICNAGLSPREAEAFMPIFFEMKEKMRNQQRKIEIAYRRAVRSNMSDKDCRRILDEVEKMELRLNNIRTDYMKRLRKLIPASKLVKALNADQNFGRDQFRKMFHSGKPEQDRK